MVAEAAEAGDGELPASGESMTDRDLIERVCWVVVSCLAVGTAIGLTLWTWN